MTENRLTHLKQLEAESIHIIREVAAEFENPVMLYSIGKDSAVMLHLVARAVMKKNLVPKSVCIRSVTINTVGIRKISVLNFGIFTMVK